MTAVFLKHYQCRKLALYNPRSYLRFGHARKSFRLSHLIAKTGIGTPRVLFYLRENRTGPKSDCLLATEGLSGALDLKSWVRNQYLSLDTVEKESFVKELARFISRLHRNGILHGDLESNALVDSQPYRFYLIDLDSVRIFGSMLKRDRTKQLTVLARRLPAVGADHEMLRLLHQTYWSQFAMRR